MATKCQQTTQALDPGLDEFVFSGTFWALGVFVVINGIWVMEQYEQYMDLFRQAKFSSIQSHEAAELLAQRKPVRYFWLQPHITSVPRQLLAIVVCSLALPVQLFELFWVYRAAWHFGMMAFHNMCAGAFIQQQPSVVRYGLYALATAAILFAGRFLWRRTVILVFSQLSYILQLRSLRPESPLELEGSEGQPRVAPRIVDIKQ